MRDSTLLALLDAPGHLYRFALLAAYAVFTLGYFFFPDYNEHYRFYARVLFWLGLPAMALGLRQLWPQPAFRVTLLYLLYLLASGFWSEPFEWYRLGQKSTISLYVVSFLAVTVYLVQVHRGLFGWLLQCSVAIAATAAIASIVTFYSEHSFPADRLRGIGSLTNINEFANVYGVFALLALGFALQTRVRYRRILYLLAIIVFVSLSWFGQSRTSLVSLVSCLLLLSGLTVERYRGRYIAVLPVLLVTLFLVFPESVQNAILRGPGLRPDIWAVVWNEAWAAPLFGNGLITQLSMVLEDKLFETAHNAYLQVFWYGGLVGTALFAVLLWLAFHGAWRLGVSGGDYTLFALFAFAACTMLTGVDTLIERPRDQWMLFWFPLALLLAAGARRRHGPGAGGTAA